MRDILWMLAQIVQPVDNALVAVNVAVPSEQDAETIHHSKLVYGSKPEAK